MAQNYIQPGKHIPVTLGADTDAGAAFLVGDLLAVALQSGKSGDQIEASIAGVWSLPKASGDITQGASLYWDDTEKKVTTDDDSGSNKKIGYAFAAAGSGDAEALVRLPF